MDLLSGTFIGVGVSCWGDAEMLAQAAELAAGIGAEVFALQQPAEQIAPHLWREFETAFSKEQGAQTALACLIRGLSAEWEKTIEHIRQTPWATEGGMLATPTLPTEKLAQILASAHRRQRQQKHQTFIADSAERILHFLEQPGQDRGLVVSPLGLRDMTEALIHRLCFLPHSGPVQQVLAEKEILLVVQGKENRKRWKKRLSMHNDQSVKVENGVRIRLLSVHELIQATPRQRKQILESTGLLILDKEHHFRPIVESPQDPDHVRFIRVLVDAGFLSETFERQRRVGKFLLGMTETVSEGAARIYGGRGGLILSETLPSLLAQGFVQKPEVRVVVPKDFPTDVPVFEAWGTLKPEERVQNLLEIVLSLTTELGSATRLPRIAIYASNREEAKNLCLALEREPLYRDRVALLTSGDAEQEERRRRDWQDFLSNIRPIMIHVENLVEGVDEFQRRPVDAVIFAGVERSGGLRYALQSVGSHLTSQTKVPLMCDEAGMFLRHPDLVHFDPTFFIVEDGKLRQRTGLQKPVGPKKLGKEKLKGTDILTMDLFGERVGIKLSEFFLSLSVSPSAAALAMGLNWPQELAAQLLSGQFLPNSRLTMENIAKALDLTEMQQRYMLGRWALDRLRYYESQFPLPDNLLPGERAVLQAARYGVLLHYSGSLSTLGNIGAEAIRRYLETGKWPSPIHYRKNLAEALSKIIGEDFLSRHLGAKTLGKYYWPSGEEELQTISEQDLESWFQAAAEETGIRPTTVIWQFVLNNGKLTTSQPLAPGTEKPRGHPQYGTLSIRKKGPHRYAVEAAAGSGVKDVLENLRKSRLCAEGILDIRADSFYDLATFKIADFEDLRIDDIRQWFISVAQKQSGRFPKEIVLQYLRGGLGNIHSLTPLHPDEADSDQKNYGAIRIRTVDSHGQARGTEKNTLRVKKSGIHPRASTRYSAGLLEGNLPSEQSEREGEAPTALPLEGATQAPMIGSDRYEILSAEGALVERVIDSIRHSAAAKSSRLKIRSDGLLGLRPLMPRDLEKIEMDWVKELFAQARQQTGGPIPLEIIWQFSYVRGALYGPKACIPGRESSNPDVGKIGLRQIGPDRYELFFAQGCGAKDVVDALRRSKLKIRSDGFLGLRFLYEEEWEDVTAADLEDYFQSVAREEGKEVEEIVVQYRKMPDNSLHSFAIISPSMANPNRAYDKLHFRRRGRHRYELVKANKGAKGAVDRLRRSLLAARQNLIIGSDGFLGVTAPQVQDLECLNEEQIDFWFKEIEKELGKRPESITIQYLWGTGGILFNMHPILSEQKDTSRYGFFIMRQTGPREYCLSKAGGNSISEVVSAIRLSPAVSTGHLTVRSDGNLGVESMWLDELADLQPCDIDLMFEEVAKKEGAERPREILLQFVIDQRDQLKGMSPVAIGKEIKWKSYCLLHITEEKPQQYKIVDIWGMHHKRALDYLRQSPIEVSEDIVPIERKFSGIKGMKIEEVEKMSLSDLDDLFHRAASQNGGKRPKEIIWQFHCYDGDHLASPQAVLPEEEDPEKSTGKIRIQQTGPDQYELFRAWGLNAKKVVAALRRSPAATGGHLAIRPDPILGFATWQLEDLDFLQLNDIEDLFKNVSKQKGGERPKEILWRFHLAQGKLNGARAVAMEMGRPHDYVDIHIRQLDATHFEIRGAKGSRAKKFVERIRKSLLVASKQLVVRSDGFLGVRGMRLTDLTDLQSRDIQEWFATVDEQTGQQNETISLEFFFGYGRFPDYISPFRATASHQLSTEKRAHRIEIKKRPEGGYVIYGANHTKGMESFFASLSQAPITQGPSPVLLVAIQN